MATPICKRLHEIVLRMQELGIEGEPLVITKNEVVPFLKELPLFASADVTSEAREILAGGKLTYAGHEVKIV